MHLNWIFILLEHESYIYCSYNVNKQHTHVDSETF